MSLSFFTLIYSSLLINSGNYLPSYTYFSKAIKYLLESAPNFSGCYILSIILAPPTNGSTYH
nr:MAG TPA: hypothetical protein [Caudoviricetes sp.]